MSEIDETAHPVIPPKQASVEPVAPAVEEAAAPAVDESAPAEAPAEVPASASEKPVEAPAETPAADVSLPVEATPVVAETPAAPVAEAPAIPEVDPLVVAHADVARLEAETARLSGEVNRLSREASDLQQTLDAERASSVKPGWEALGAQVTEMRLQVANLEAENARLQSAQPLTATLEATAGLSDDDVARVKDAMLAALAEHAIAQSAPDENPTPSPIARGMVG